MKRFKIHALETFGAELLFQARTFETFTFQVKQFSIAIVSCVW